MRTSRHPVKGQAMYELRDDPEPRPLLRVVRDEDPPTYDAAAKPRHTPGFGLIPAEVRALKSGECVAVYDAIASHANKDGEAWPSIQRLCELTGWSRKIVERSIARLIEAGILTKERRFTAGMKNSNLYRLTAYGRIVPTEPSIVPTERLDSSHSTIGSSPQNHELDPIELDPNEQKRERVRATRIPEDFAITHEMRGWARDRCAGIDPDLETEKFRLYWESKSGSGATKLDWEKTWKSWMLRAKEFRPKRETVENAGGKGQWVGV